MKASHHLRNRRGARRAPDRLPHRLRRQRDLPVSRSSRPRREILDRSRSPRGKDVTKAGADADKLAKAEAALEGRGSAHLREGARRTCARRSKTGCSRSCPRWASRVLAQLPRRADFRGHRHWRRRSSSECFDRHAVAGRRHRLRGDRPRVAHPPRAKASPPCPRRRNGPSLEDAGFYRFRRAGERHAVTPPVIQSFHSFVKTNNAEDYQKYVDAGAAQQPITFKDLLEFVPRTGGPIPIEEVEIDRGHPHAFHHRGHVARRALARGARSARHRDEPHRRQIELRRRRRRSRAFQAPREWRQRQLRDQADRQRPLRRHRGVPRQRQGDRNQDGAGREARRRRPASRPQGQRASSRGCATPCPA